MTPIEKLFSEKKFPKWFSNHPIFKEVKTIKKVFPGIGLPNFEQEMKDNGDVNIDNAENLIKNIRAELSTRQERLKDFIKNRKVGAERVATSNRILNLLSSVEKLLAEDKNIIQNNNGKIALKLTSNISIDGDKNPTFRTNESLFRVYNKLNDMLQSSKFASMHPLDELHSFKQFSAQNIPNNNKYKVVFSSDGIDGAWDIGTMSSRGIRSCQSWDTGEYKHCTIGSVIDPFVGIIYLTSGSKFNSYGTKMIRRCIVRFLVNEETNKPFILIDQMYPELDKKVLKQFEDTLKARTNNKFDVYYAPTADRQILLKSYIPLNDIRKKLFKSSRTDGEYFTEDDLDEYDTIQSYQDFKIKSKISNKMDKEKQLFDKNSKRKLNVFKNQFSSAFEKAVKSIDIAAFSDNIKPAIRKLKGTDKSFNYTYLLPTIGNDIAKSFVAVLNRDDFDNSNFYFKRLYFNYFTNKNKIFNEIKTKIVRELNGKLGLKGNSKLRSTHFISIMNVISKEMNTDLKKHFKDFLDTGKVASSKRK